LRWPSPGVAWDNGKPYTGKGGSGFGVRLLIELARANAGAPDLH
jgi:leucyl aminopeptidase